MSRTAQFPSATGQLVWSPADPTLGVGVITQVEGTRLHVHFLRLGEERVYTSRRADCAIIRYDIEAGERVRHRAGGDYRIAEVLDENIDRLKTYELDDGRACTETELVPDIRDIGPKERLATLNLVHPEVVRTRVHGLELADWGARPGVASILGTRVQWLPHQVDVSTRAIAHDPVRLLLADEVGLGKTVEAALIYAGLRAEGRAKRVLILTPQALCIQWLGEIYRKSHELLVLLDEERIEASLEMDDELNPFEAHQRIITSIPKVAGSRRLTAQATHAEWDLVVVDEAHHLRWDEQSGGNAAYKLVERLAGQTRNMLLLTATPMALDPAEYHALLRLLDRDRFEDPTAFGAVRERVAGLCAAARHLAFSVDHSESIDDVTADLTRELLADAPEDLELFEELLSLDPSDGKRAEQGEQVLDLLRDRHGLTDYVVRNRRGPVGGLPQRQPHTIALEPTEMQDILIDVGESVVLEVAETITDDAERYRTMGQMLRAMWATPGALLEIARGISPILVQQLEPHVLGVLNEPADSDGLPTGDARLRWLVQLIRKSGGEKLLVFVESAVAVRALKEALDIYFGGKVAVFHRELSPRDQDRQVAWFRDPSGPQLMLSTEAGGEGRNFQFCHHVVLYDLPWRPATIEQRIGRVDRVGQTHDVEVYVPYFKSGYEAAILKVMQQSIGVLDKTVGGIDHALEYVSSRLAQLVYEGCGVEEWRELYADTERLVKESTDRIEASADPILDHASFSNDRAQAVLGTVPVNLEESTEAFVRGYAEHSRLKIAHKDTNLVAIDGAPGAAGEHMSTGYVATFSRLHALDHEDVEFISFGHPLMDQALEWAHEATDATAALAVCRGFDEDGAIFLWRYALDVPEDAPEVGTYFQEHALTLALDEAGKRRPMYESLLDDDSRPLDRMDATPLKGSLDRWRKVVEHNYDCAQTMCDDAFGGDIGAATALAESAFDKRFKHLERMQRREKNRLGNSEASEEELRDAMHRQETVRDDLLAEKSRVLRAVENVRLRLQASVAVRLVRSSRVSG
ncbi:MAG: DEAD/DEAH box helicase family protein [Deltaproteobacteria bacterium]|nr:DEAD/DEAH box helicase family protein [Deltaproteobacteria bacterium]